MEVYYRVQIVGPFSCFAISYTSPFTIFSEIFISVVGRRNFQIKCYIYNKLCLMFLFPHVCSFLYFFISIYLYFCLNTVSVLVFFVLFLITNNLSWNTICYAPDQMVCSILFLIVSLISLSVVNIEGGYYF